MTTITKEFAVQGMHCQGCVSSVTGAVKRVPGVARVDVSLEKNAATVEFDPATANPASIVAAIEGAGFDAQTR
jgi:copper chaperone